MNEVPNTPTTIGLEKIDGVCRRTGMSQSRLYRAMQDGEFPRPVRIGARSVGWPAADVDAWIAARPRTADGTAPGGKDTLAEARTLLAQKGHAVRRVEGIGFEVAAFGNVATFKSRREVAAVAALLPAAVRMPV